MTNMDKLYEAVAARGPVCVGLDTDFSYLPADFVDTALTKGENIVRFNKKLIDATKAVAGCYKVQIAYYESLGLEGMKAYAETLAAVREAGIPVIADIKRGDIANNVISRIATGSAGSGDVMSGNMAADALMSYMGYTALGEGAADIPNFSNVEIGGGHITGMETSEEEPDGRAFAMYSTGQYMEPKREYTTVTTVDGAKWYRQYAQDVVEKKPYQNPDGGISYRESLIRRLPDPPRRKDKT